METLVFQQMYHEFPLQFAIRSVSGITHTSPKTHLNSASLARRYTTANGKFLYAKKLRPFSFTYREKNNEICRASCENRPLN